MTIFYVSKDVRRNGEHRYTSGIAPAGETTTIGATYYLDGPAPEDATLSFQLLRDDDFGDWVSPTSFDLTVREGTHNSCSTGCYDQIQEDGP